MNVFLVFAIGCLSAFAFAFGLTWWLRRVALRQGIMDVPNQRSSHSAPTPRGGGVSFVVVGSLSLLVLAGSYTPDVLWITIPALAVAGIGYLDDRQDLSAKVRMLVHLISAAAVVYGVGGLPALTFFGFSIELGLFGDLVAVIALVWLLNLYNFMDGINGIASLEAITSLCVIAVLAFSMHLVGAGLATSLLAASVLGFLFWNFPVGRIFMGDAGSGFLGFILAAMALWMAQISEVWLWGWLIMLGVFVVDATFTLLRRLVRGEKVYEAHCSHAYQIAAKRKQSHVVVSSAVAIINLVWLAPMTWAVVYGHIDGFAGLLIAYAPLIVLAIINKAGSKE